MGAGAAAPSPRAEVAAGEEGEEGVPRNRAEAVGAGEEAFLRHPAAAGAADRLRAGWTTGRSWAQSIAHPGPPGSPIGAPRRPCDQILNSLAGSVAKLFFTTARPMGLAGSTLKSVVSRGNTRSVALP